MNGRQPRLLLASASPHRRALLRTVGIRFRTAVTGVSEIIDEPCDPVEAASIIAERKARAAQAAMRRAEWVLAADTTVIVAGARLGKPNDSAMARRMLAALEGREHQVITGVTLATPEGIVTEVVTTSVRMHSLSDGEIDGYLSTGEWKDAAGGYRIQSQGAMLVEHLAGSYSNVVGLPLERLYVMLGRAGWEIWASG